MTRRSRFLLVPVVVVFLIPVRAIAQSPSAAPAAAPGVPGVTAASAILVSLDDDDGRVLFSRRVHDRRAPASLTKIATALVARDLYRLDEVVAASPLVLQTHGSDLGLEPGMRITVRDLLYSLLLKSANDVAMALAAYDNFGYEHFIQLMNEKARSLGAHETQFRNPHGLDQIGHYSTAWDMALLTRAVLADPVLARIVATQYHTMPWSGGRVRYFGNHNKLLRRYAGAIGVKTGFTAQAGHCLIAAASTSYGRVFTVVLNSQNHYADSTALIDHGKAIEVARASGGGAVDAGRPLAVPPAPPGDVPLANSVVTGLDPRDDGRFIVIMLMLAALAFGTLGFRRRSQAEVHAWLETLLPRSERR